METQTRHHYPPTSNGYPLLGCTVRSKICSTKNTGEWIDYVESDSLRTYVAYYDGSPAGYFELRHDRLNDVEITYFGLAPKFIGRGLGGYLLTVALKQAWALSPHRVWVHTCSRDHASALPNYQARGFKIYREEYVPV